MNERRLDMSNWVIHFIHDRNPENDPVLYDEHGDGEPVPWHADQEKEERFWNWKVKEEEESWNPCEAFEILLKILDEGHIRAGWAFRGKRPTIYGPRPACCFTEMPLYALLDYAKTRARSSVDVYGVALPKSEFFLRGGRPVIYGLSGEHREILGSKWPRMLEPSCGIGEDEQYRYVSMKLGPGKRVDWSHEREWRWCDSADACSCPGLPVWLDDEPVRFERILVLVKSRGEVQRVLDQLREMYDSGWHNYVYPFSRRAIKATRVLAVEDLVNSVGPQEAFQLRLDDVPAAALELLEETAVDEATLARAEKTWQAAVQAAANAAERFRMRNSLDVFGWADLMMYRPRSLLARALIHSKRATALAGIGYRIEGITDACTTHLLGEEEAAVDAAIEVFEKEYPDEVFDCRSIRD